MIGAQISSQFTGSIGKTGKSVDKGEDGELRSTQLVEAGVPLG